VHDEQNNQTLNLLSSQSSDVLSRKMLSEGNIHHNLI